MRAPRRHPSLLPARPGAALVRLLARLRRDQSGMIAITMTVMAMVIFGFVGLAADASAWYTIQMRMQTAADAAALNAALTHWGGGGDYQAAAEDDAARNGFCISSDHALCPAGVQATGIASDVEATLLDTRIRVTITGPGGLFTFSRLFLDEPATIVAWAEAGLVVERLLCLLTLATSGERSLHLNSNSEVNAQACDVHVNSSHSSNALYTDSQAELHAHSICVRGGVNEAGGSEITPTPTTGSADCPTLADPLLSIAEPAIPSTCTATNYERSGGTHVLNPGRYCGGIKISGSANVTFNPGTYSIVGGEGLFLDSNSVATGNGVTFHFSGGARLRILSNSRATLSGPTSGALRGILFFEARNNSTGLEHEIDSNANVQVFDGAFYFSRNRLRIDSNGELNSNAACMIMIAPHIEFNSNVQVNLVSDADSCASFLPDALSDTTITLVA